jgi:hypothetical protein
MTITPEIYANLALTAIAIILLLILATLVLILRRLGLNTQKPDKKEAARTEKTGGYPEKEGGKNRAAEDTDPSALYSSQSIEENLKGLFSHYRLNSFTMATSDGLVISSTDKNPEEDAAKYSYLYLQGKQPQSSKIRLIGVPHKGGTVVGIIKSDEELPKEDLSLIERDIRYILRRNM